MASLTRTLRSRRINGAASGRIIELENVEKVYSTRQGGQTPALTAVSLAVNAGEFVSLVGPSGCGKTTLLKICAGLLAPTSGAVRFLGTPGPAPPGAYGIVFQNAALLPWRTVMENLLFPADILKLDRNQARERARRLLLLARLDDVEDKYPGELSGGMQQRASLARALLHDPEILFMDEPFGALDALTREGLNLELQQIHLDQRKTIAFITHNIQEAVLLSDRIVVMTPRPGKMAAEVSNPMPRPRTLADSLKDEFRSIEVKVRSLLEQGGEGG
ncbi:MAG: ABC transporter ATP-binding protein [Acidobacteriota bacterium]